MYQLLLTLIPWRLVALAALVGVGLHFAGVDLLTLAGDLLGIGTGWLDWL